MILRGTVHTYRARIGRAALDAEIKALRASLDLTAGQRAYDLDRARRHLYALLFGPVDGWLSGIQSSAGGAGRATARRFRSAPW